MDTPDAAAIAEEQRSIDKLRRLVDVACAVLFQAELTRKQAEALVSATRRNALGLFPDKAEVFDLVIAPRLRRILDERWPPSTHHLLPFRPRSL